MDEAYSHECISAGWWPGSLAGPLTDSVFYAYVYPEPPGCPEALVRPADAGFHAGMREWTLPYEAVRRSADPDRIFRVTCQLARQVGLVGVKRVLDSAPLEDAVTTQDTVTMLRGAIRGLLRACPPELEARVRGFEPVLGEGGSKRQAEQDAAAKLLAIVAPTS